MKATLSPYNHDQGDWSDPIDSMATNGFEQGFKDFPFSKQTALESPTEATEKHRNTDKIKKKSRMDSITAETADRVITERKWQEYLALLA